MPEKYKATRPELAAVILAAAFIWLPLFMAPSSCGVGPGVTYSINKESKCGAYENAREWIALGTSRTDWATLLVLLLQAGIFARQVRISDAQTNIQQRQHIAIHRPKLIVRRPVLIRTPWGKSERIFVRFEVVNVGGGTAVGHLSVINAWNVPRGDFPYIGLARTDEVLRNQTILAGSSRVINHISPVTAATFGRISAAPPDLESRAQDFLFAGIIVYTDENMTMYRTGIWRTYDFDTGRFVKSDDPDYEYQD